ncbi:GDCCVxC domain-containing (seleno)protein [Sinobacterium norvegicum]|uniref:GDCCVxC domain-containing (seleno)protein n=1 Tax=Sinobacterium norvegicum TaxID=1641715 RepID=UPI00338D6EA9
MRSIIQCPHCGFKAVEDTLATELLADYRCLACAKLLQAAGADPCCIFCSFGTVPCVQSKNKGGKVSRRG